MLDKYIILYTTTNNHLTNNHLTNNHLTNNQSTNNHLTNNQSTIINDQKRQIHTTHSVFYRKYA
jgi:hypothetical protein